MTVDLVLDIETFGTREGCAVASIGAVTLAGGEFYLANTRPSGVFERGGVEFWMRQPEAARAALRVPHEIRVRGMPEQTIAHSEPQVLELFAKWVGAVRLLGGAPLRVWGSEDFDTRILGPLYDRYPLIPDQPWEYDQVRGLRTILEAAGVMDGDVSWRNGAVEHIAIDCARHAADELREAFRRLGHIDRSKGELRV